MSNVVTVDIISNDSIDVEITSNPVIKVIALGQSVIDVEMIYSVDFYQALQAKSCVPMATAQNIVSDTGYYGLSGVGVAAVPYSSVINEAGGNTVTILD